MNGYKTSVGAANPPCKRVLQNSGCCNPCPKWVLQNSGCCSPPSSWVPPRSQQQVEELEAQRAGVQQELLELREELSRAALEAEVARGEREALVEALEKVGAPATPWTPLQWVQPPLMQQVHPMQQAPLCSG